MNIQAGGDNPSTVRNIKIKDPYEDGNVYDTLFIRRHLSNMNLIRTEANTLASDVDAFIDGLLQKYNRGEIPLQKVVPSSALWKEYSYEEGSGSHAALALSQLGVETDIERPVTIREYPQGYDPDATGSNPDEDGEVYNGYMANIDIKLESGVIYTQSDFDTMPQLVRDTGVYDITNKFRVEKIELYQEDGTVQEVESVTPKDYQFDPRSADSYEQDYENVESAREEATKNPELDLGGLGGSGSLGGLLSSLPPWAAPFALLGVAGLTAWKVITGSN